MLDMKQGEIDAFFGLWLAIVIGGGGLCLFGSDDVISDRATFPTPLGQLYINSH